MNTKPIQDFIITNERNLRIAAAVSEAWPEARGQLVSGFLDRLGSTLIKTLKGWNFKHQQQWFVAGYPSFFIWKPEWKEEYVVDLCCYDCGKKMVFGISRDAEKEHIKKRAHCVEVLNAVNKIHPKATVNDWWEARMNMQTPAPDWRKPEVLWRMHTDATFLNEVARQLVEVANITEPIIDRFILAK